MQLFVRDPQRRVPKVKHHSSKIINVIIDYQRVPETLNFIIIISSHNIPILKCSLSDIKRVNKLSLNDIWS